MAAFFYNPLYLFLNPTTRFLASCYPEQSFEYAAPLSGSSSPPTPTLRVRQHAQSHVLPPPAYLIGSNWVTVPPPAPSPIGQM